MQVNIKEDLSKLTTIDESVFAKLMSKVEWCISDCLEKSILAGENEARIDIGLGTIVIYFTDEEVKYRFIPDAKFEKIVVNTIVNERNDLVLNIEESLISKLINTYKNFF